ncbi:DIBOA-glucoside dioxygenase BX6-like isoform X2 [Phragmites australis]|uniref:DIBOA-glucoside dioxygenase BX6-like isoform X2 n=1 Tax=Phragmites australis TaxID=29695 RepID=UPI002D786592|nr:DIBOA-glucoside dioxygenase BX6-like isoform X2 [Phragmites australis]
MSTTTKAPGLASDGYDRRRELQAFDDTKAGVKGLVDAGITAVPAIFRHQQQQQQVTTSISSPSSVLSCSIPVIDLSVADEPRGRQEVVAQVKAASETAGFFQVVNHGVPGDLLSEMLASVKRFNEEAAEEKRPYYTRDTGRKVRFNSNFDLFQSPAANWRDTLFCEAAPEPPRLEELPVAVRHALLEYGAAARTLAVRVLELLSEALGLARDHLREMGCVEGLSVDDDHAMGGLQVLLDHPAAGARWVDVPPLPGALLINIGDLLQLVSNGRFKSVEHRVVANKSRDTPRVSVACFCNADIARSTRLYGPIASDDPPVYRSVTVPEFLAHYDKKGLDGRPTLHYFQLPK